MKKKAQGNNEESTKKSTSKNEEIKNEEAKKKVPVKNEDKESSKKEFKGPIENVKSVSIHKTGKPARPSINERRTGIYFLKTFCMVLYC